MNTTIFALHISNIKQSPFITGTRSSFLFKKVKFFNSINPLLYSQQVGKFKFESSQFTKILNHAIRIESSSRTLIEQNITQTLTDIDVESLDIMDCIFMKCQSNHIGGAFLYNPSSSYSYFSCHNTIFQFCSSESSGAFCVISKNDYIISCCFANCYAHVANQAFSLQCSSQSYYTDSRIEMCTFLNCPDYVIHSHQLFTSTRLKYLSGINVSHCNNNLPGIFFKVRDNPSSCSYSYFYNNTGQYPIVLSNISKFELSSVMIMMNSIYDGVLLVQATTTIPQINFKNSYIKSNKIYRLNAFGSSFSSYFQYYYIDQSVYDFLGKFGTVDSESFRNDIQTMRSSIKTIQGCYYRERTYQTTLETIPPAKDNMILYSISACAIGIAIGATIAVVIYYVKKQKSVKEWFKQEIE